MRLLPPNLVGVTRSYIQSQGLNPYMVKDDGSLDPTGVLELLFNNAEVRTSVTPPLFFPTGPGGTPTDSVTAELVKRLQPTVILTGPAGRVEIAPYGTASAASSWVPLILVGGGLAALVGWLVFGGRR